MCKYLEKNYMQIYFALLLITLNVPLQIGKCTPGGALPQVGNPWYLGTVRTKSIYVEMM